MKCIETHPVRNKLVSKEPVSAKLLQQLDLLKKELVLRDVINGVCFNSYTYLDAEAVFLQVKIYFAYRKMPGYRSLPDHRSSRHTDRAISW